MNTNMIKNKLNIVGRCYVKDNAAGGEILSFIPDVPISGYLDDFLFILTLPADKQKYAPAYCRLQDKSKIDPSTIESIDEFTEVRSVGYLIEKKVDIIVCAPKVHTFVELDKIVIIATIPSDGKFAAPCYIKKKLYEKSKSELIHDDQSNTIDEIVVPENDFVDELMKD